MKVLLLLTVILSIVLSEGLSDAERKTSSSVATVMLKDNLVKRGTIIAKTSHIGMLLSQKRNPDKRIKDLENNSFNLINFYERRARRILPALYFMILTSVIIGWFILTPYFYRDLFQTITAISLFMSNYLIYLKSG